MPKLVLTLFFIISLFIIPSITQARTTPEDIINAQKDTYNQRIKNYSASNKQKLQTASDKIELFNKEKTDLLETNMVRQGQILDEYMRRNHMEEGPETDGIHRNLSKPVENARYWLTYAHEAVAYQAAKIYIFNLTSEGNINGDINSQISQLQSDLNTLRSKVVKSQQIIADLVSK